MTTQNKSIREVIEAICFEADISDREYERLVKEIMSAFDTAVEQLKKNKEI